MFHCVCEVRVRVAGCGYCNARSWWYQIHISTKDGDDDCETVSRCHHIANFYGKNVTQPAGGGPLWNQTSGGMESEADAEHTAGSSIHHVCERKMIDRKCHEMYQLDGGCGRGCWVRVPNAGYVYINRPNIIPWESTENNIGKLIENWEGWTNRSWLSMCKCGTRLRLRVSTSWWEATSSIYNCYLFSCFFFCQEIKVRMAVNCWWDNPRRPSNIQTIKQCPSSWNVG